ncbi:CBS domain-containing protein [Humibacter albus]|uniref:CBS domain-containing protein n=1 Tax=Humibacter albus TaxID=427754 RepID=UPI0003B5F805|nr:CBS domain-containing protein [Humibacter albus]
MTTVSEIMSSDVACIAESDTLEKAARVMADLSVGAVPICDDQGNPVGIVTDRDIVVSCIATGGDPTTTTAEGFVGDLVSVAAQDDIEDALEEMQENQVRRVLVFDGGAFAGILSQADVALAATSEDTGRTVAAVSMS